MYNCLQWYAYHSLRTTGLSDEVRKLLKEKLRAFIHIEVVKQSDPFEVDIHSSKSRVKIDDVYLGLSATMTLSECCERDPDGVRQIRLLCLNFMIELVQQIRKRFEDTRSKKFQLLGFLIPSNAIKCQPPSLQGLFQEFTFLNDVAQADMVDMEWRKQAIEEPGDVKDVVNDVKLWKDLLNKKNVVSELKYKNLSKVVGCLMALLFANAPVERLFSIVKDIKQIKGTG